MPHIFRVLAVFLVVAGAVFWPRSYNEAIPSLSDRVEPWKLTASEALGMIQADEMSVREYAESLLERIKAHDEDIKAWAYLDDKRVLQEARRLDEIPKKNRGPLHGLPIAVKEVIYTKDMPTQFNSPLYEGHFPETDAASVRILRHAGALIFGKTTTTEFAAIHVGPKTRNPHDFLRTPGGSSSGSGAAVADFQGQKIYALMYDTLGWYGRGVDDLILLTDVFDLQDDKDEEHAFKGIEGAHFAICKTSVWSMAGPGTQDALARAADHLRSHGAEVEEIGLPEEFDNAPEWYRIGFHTEGRTSFLPEYRVGKDQMGKS
ncbi:Amidase signature domain [Fusarium oxysporum f. sp. vasinfectum]|nr:Amidase signature domain [Fusarium oxysporum f. sp. vasinfectum]